MIIMINFVNYVCYNDDGDYMKINIGISARHVHLNKDDFKILFGENASLTNIKDLTQKGEFAALECVSIEANDKKIDDVRIIGPIRSYTQVEISKTDSYMLKLNPPVRNSGDIKDSENITIIGPKGKITKEEGCIIANRHIHMNEEDARLFDVKDGDEVSVYLDTEKSAILKNVYIKMAPTYQLELHIDLDDANANLVTQETKAEIIK